MRKKFPVLLLVGISMLLGFFIQAALGAHSSQDLKILKIATLEWPPYSSKELENHGFSMEIITAVFKDAGYELKIASLPWKRVLREVEKGKFDVAACAYPSEERSRKYWLSDSFLSAPLGFFKMHDRDFVFSKLEDLKGLRIGTVRGYVNSEEFDKASYLTREPVDKDEQNYRKLINDRLDLVVGDKANGLYIRHKLRETTKDPEELRKLDLIEFIHPPLIDYTLHVLVSRANPKGQDIQMAFNRSLAKLKADGSIDRIIQSHGFLKNTMTL